MNIIQTVKPAITAFAASEGGKVVGKIGKNVLTKAAAGLNLGAGVAAFYVGVKFGYKIAEKSANVVLEPLADVIGKWAESAKGNVHVTINPSESKESAEAEQEKTDVPEKEPEETK